MKILNQTGDTVPAHDLGVAMRANYATGQENNCVVEHTYSVYQSISPNHGTFTFNPITFDGLLMKFPTGFMRAVAKDAGINVADRFARCVDTASSKASASLSRRSGAERPVTPNRVATYPGLPIRDEAVSADEAPIAEDENLPEPESKAPSYAASLWAMLIARIYEVLDEIHPCIAHSVQLPAAQIRS